MSEKAGSPSRDARPMVPLSPEEAEKAAAAFAPLWQLDDAPFEVGAGLTLNASEGLRALAEPIAAAVATNLGPTPAVSAPILPLGGHPTLPAVPSPMRGEVLENTTPAAAESELMSRATVRMAPPVAVHQPIAARPTEPALPSIIIAESAAPHPPVVAPELPPAPPREPPAPSSFQLVTAPMPLIARPPPAPEPSADFPPPRRQLRTDPPVAPGRSARRAPLDAEYRVPRSRTPVVVGVAILGSALLAFGGYALLSGNASPPPPVHAETPPRPTAADPSGPAIPPPVPPDEAPVAVQPPPGVPPAPTPVAPARVHASPPPQPPPVAQAPKAPPPARPPPKPPASKNSTSPATGGIVRDNPF